MRQEFIHVPAEAYSSGRPAYFERQLSDPAHRFYLSRGLAHLEARARANLAREIELLRSGGVPMVASQPRPSIATASTAGMPLFLGTATMLAAASTVLVITMACASFMAFSRSGQCQSRSRRPYAILGARICKVIRLRPS